MDIESFFRENKSKPFILLFVSSIAFLFTQLSPVKFDLNQTIILISLASTIAAWVIDFPNKKISSLFLIIIFIIFGKTSAKVVLSFPLSFDFLLIVFSFVLSQGIINSKLAELLFQPLLSKFSKNVYQFITFTLLVIIIMVFTIPQPYSRVILFAMIYNNYFDEIDLPKDTRQVLLLGIFIFNVIVHIFFKRGDIVLNNGLLAVAGVTMNEFEWMKTLTVPAMGMLILSVIAFLIIFKKELVKFKGNPEKVYDINLTRDDKLNLLLIIVIILLWATENLHNINAVYVVFVGLVIMYLRNLIEFKDLKAIDLEVLLFITAAFSIGKVMEGSGIADIIFGGLGNLIPQTMSLKFIWTVAITTMILHMLLGSSTTTMSLVIPGFISIVGSNIDPLIIMLIVFVSIVTQFLLPYHNTILVVGVGNDYFTTKQVFRLGVGLTIVTFISLFLFYIPWWTFIGVL